MIRDLRIATRAVAPLAVLTSAAAILVFFPPAQNSFYPQCPIQEYLHLQCPGCGATRALASLLRGHLTEAIRFNALVTLLLPVAAAYAVRCYCRLLQRKPLRLPQTPPAATCIAFVAAIVFTVMRNLPFHSF
jgi:Protein of unknown function (DUF2752)